MEQQERTNTCPSLYLLCINAVLSLVYWVNQEVSPLKYRWSAIFTTSPLHLLISSIRQQLLCPSRNEYFNRIPPTENTIILKLNIGIGYVY